MNPSTRGRGRQMSVFEASLDNTEDPLPKNNREGRREEEKEIPYGISLRNFHLEENILKLSFYITKGWISLSSPRDCSFSVFVQIREVTRHLTLEPNPPVAVFLVYLAVTSVPHHDWKTGPGSLFHIIFFCNYVVLHLPFTLTKAHDQRFTHHQITLLEGRDRCVEAMAIRSLLRGISAVPELVWQHAMGSRRQCSTGELQWQQQWPQPRLLPRTHDCASWTPKPVGVFSCPQFWCLTFNCSRGHQGPSNTVSSM